MLISRDDYTVCMVCDNGWRYNLFSCNDRFTAEVWAENHRECTYALMMGRAKLIIEDNRPEQEEQKDVRNLCK